MKPMRCSDYLPRCKTTELSTRDHSYMQAHAAFGRARPFNVFPPGFTQRPNREVMEAGAAKERRYQREASGSTVQCVAVSCGWITLELEGALFPSGPAHCLPALVPPKFH